MELHQHPGAKILLLRKDKGLGQGELVTRAQGIQEKLFTKSPRLTQPRLSEIESKKKTPKGQWILPSIEQAVAIAKALEVPITEILPPQWTGIEPSQETANSKITAEDSSRLELYRRHPEFFDAVAKLEELGGDEILGHLKDQIEICVEAAKSRQRQSS